MSTSTGKKRQIWTMGYFPFTMGGKVDRPIVTEVGYIEEKNIGKGFRAFSFRTPKGNIRIAECLTGAIVGGSFEEVIADVKAAKKGVILKQIEEGKVLLKDAKHYAAKEFFKIYAK